MMQQRSTLRIAAARFRSGLRRLPAVVTVFLACLFTLSESLAIRPLTPWHELEERAAVDGADAVRDEFRSRITALLDSLSPQPPRDTKEFYERFITLGTLIEYSKSWAAVEGRSVQGQGAVQSRSRENCAEILGVARRAVAALSELKANAPAIEAQQTETERGRFGRIVQNVGSLDRNSGELASRTASLAAVTNSPDLLNEAFDVFRDGIPSAKRTYRSPAEFLESPPDFNQEFGATGIIPRRAKTLSEPPPELAEADRAEAIRLVGDVLSAVVARSETLLVAAYVDENEARAHAAALERSPVRVIDFDLTNARYTFEPIGGNEVAVTVSDIELLVLQEGVQRSVKGRKTYRMDFSSGRPLILGIGNGS